MNALKELESLALAAKQAKYPNAPPYGIPKTKYSDKTANDLTKAIVHYIRLKGGYAARINVQGQFNEKLNKWIKSGSTIGTSDIIACLNGIFLSIEIKINRDQQSEAQIKAQEQVEAAGGHYLVVKDFQSFYEYLSQFSPD